MVATPTYSSFRLKLPDSAFSIATISGTTTTDSEGTWNVYICAENRVGINQLSNPKSLAVAAGEGIEVTITSDAIAAGEDPFWIVVAIEKTGNIADAARVGNFKVKEDNQLVNRSLPITIQLTTDRHFEVNYNVATFNDLETVGFLDGLIAGVADSGNYYRYDSESFIDGDNRYISYGTYAEGENGWVKDNAVRSAYLTDTEVVSNDVSGCDRPLKNIDTALKIPPKKIADIDSTPITYWLNNGFADDGGSPLIDGCFNFQVFIDGSDFSGLFAEKIKYILLGYVNRADGSLDTSMTGVGATAIWSPTTPVKLPVDLPRNHAAVYQVWFSYDAADLRGLLPDHTELFEFNIVEVGNNTGQLDSVANFFKDLVYSDRNKLLIVPGEKRLSGVATIEMSGSSKGFLIDDSGEQNIFGLLPDTPNQIAAISGSTNGLVTIRQDGEALQYSEKVRAIISTVPGISSLTVAGSDIALSNEGLKVTVSHPVTTGGNGIVRVNYPDPYLAGNELGAFTATEGYVFLDVDGVFYQSTLQLVQTTQTQEFDFTDIAEFTVIGSLPVQADEAFSLFEATAITVGSNGVGAITGSVIRVYWGYAYEANNIKATSIRHDLPDVIPMMTATIAEVLAELNALRDHVLDLENPHAVTLEQLGGASQADLDTTNQAVLANSTAIANLPVVQAYSVNTIAERDALTDVEEASICKVADDGTGNPANYFYNDGAWEQYADLIGGASGTANNVYEVADITARDAIASPEENDIAKVADDGTGNARDYVYNGTAWLALIGGASGTTNNVYEVADIATRDGLTGVIENDIAKVADDGTGNPKDYIYNGTAWIEFVSAVQSPTEIRDALQTLTDPDKLVASAIAGLRNIANNPSDKFGLVYDLATDSLNWEYVNRGIGAGAILIPLSQSLFQTADGALSGYSADVGSATYTDVKILTTAGTPDNQIVSNQLVINTVQTGAVLDLGVSDTVVRSDWTFNTGDVGAFILRYESDGNMVLLEMAETAIALKSIVSDVETTFATESFTFANGTSYKIEVQILGVGYKVLIDDVEVIAEGLSNAFIDGTNFGAGRRA